MYILLHVSLLLGSFSSCTLYFARLALIRCCHLCHLPYFTENLVFYTLTFDVRIVYTQYQNRLGGKTKGQRIRVQIYRLLTFNVLCHVMLLLPIAIFLLHVVFSNRNFGFPFLGNLQFFLHHKCENSLRN